MRDFNYHKLAERTWDNEILSYLAQIHEHKSNNWMSQPTRSLNGRGSLLVCPGNSKSVSLRGSLYPVTKYWEKRSFFPRRKEIIALCRQACKLGRYKSGTG